jgi:hypothetical protein
MIIQIGTGEEAIEGGVNRAYPKKADTGVQTGAISSLRIRAYVVGPLCQPVFEFDSGVVRSKKGGLKFS